MRWRSQIQHEHEFVDQSQAAGLKDKSEHKNEKSARDHALRNQTSQNCKESFRFNSQENFGSFETQITAISS